MAGASPRRHNRRSVGQPHAQTFGMPLDRLLNVACKLVAGQFRMSSQRQQVNVDRIGVRGGEVR